MKHSMPKNSPHTFIIKVVVVTTRFELVTPTMSRQCSNQLSYATEERRILLSFQWFASVLKGLWHAFAHHNVRVHSVSDSYSDYRGGSPLVRAHTVSDLYSIIGVVTPCTSSHCERFIFRLSGWITPRTSSHCERFIFDIIRVDTPRTSSHCERFTFDIIGVGAPRTSSHCERFIFNIIGMDHPSYELTL